MLSVKGTYRVLDIYQGKGVVYTTLKSKADGSKVKVGIPDALIDPQVFKDDALIVLEGALLTSVFNNQTSLTFGGKITPGKE